jgi:hypothetical protein
MIVRSVATTAAAEDTVDLTKALPASAAIQPAENVQHLYLSNGSDAPLYVLFDWQTGDDEPAATNLHLVVPAGANRDLHFARPVQNMRILAGDGAIGIIAW